MCSHGRHTGNWPVKLDAPAPDFLQLFDSAVESIVLPSPKTASCHRRRSRDHGPLTHIHPQHQQQHNTTPSSTTTPPNIWSWPAPDQTRISLRSDDVALDASRPFQLYSYNILISHFINHLFFSPFSFSATFQHAPPSLINE